MDDQQEIARHFIRELSRITGWPVSRLAKEGGLSHTTLSRFLNNDNVTHTLSLRTIDKLKRAASRVVPEDQIDMLWLLAQRRPPRNSDNGTPPRARLR